MPRKELFMEGRLERLDESGNPVRKCTGEELKSQAEFRGKLRFESLTGAGMDSVIRWGRKKFSPQQDEFPCLGKTICTKPVVVHATRKSASIERLLIGSLF